MRQVNYKVTGWLPSLLVAARPYKAELCTHMGCSLRSIPSSLEHNSQEGNIEKISTQGGDYCAMQSYALGSNLILKDRENCNLPSGNKI